MATRAGMLRIGEMARAIGVSPDTLRYYERMGLLPKVERTAAGYREYPEGSLERVRLVRSALQFGFSLKQVANFLRARESGRPPCHEVRAAGEEILARVDGQIKDLQAARRSIRQTLAEWDRRMKGHTAAHPARLLQAIDVGGASVSATWKKRLRKSASLHGRTFPLHPQIRQRTRLQSQPAEKCNDESS